MVKMVATVDPSFVQQSTIIVKVIPNESSCFSRVVNSCMSIYVTEFDKTRLRRTKLR